MIEKVQFEPPKKDMTTWRLIVELEVTRRKYLSFVINPKDEILYSSLLLTNCIEWLRNEGCRTIMTSTKDGDHTLLINPHTPKKDSQQ